jgi:ABC-2 type transport system ATP-binding protein
MQAPPVRPEPATRPDPVISVEGLTKRFGVTVAVDDISFRIAPGTVAGLLGGNGAGKTTTIAMLLGLLVPSAGMIAILGHDMVRHRHRALPAMNFASPYIDLPHRLTVRQNLTVYAGLYRLARPRDRVAELAEELDFVPLADRIYGSLSAGQKTRIGLAKALINRPRVLLLDEPTASLDPDSAERIRVYLQDYARTAGATLLIASHNMLEVERLCTEILIMRRGRIVDTGSPASLLGRYRRDTLEEVFLDIARAPEAAGAARAAKASQAGGIR